MSVIRPVLEYACPVWHTCLPKYMSDSIEIIQRRALRTIYPGNSHDVSLEMSGLDTLLVRRDNTCRDYFRKMYIHVPSHKLYKRLPAARQVPYDMRCTNTLPVSLCRTNRFKNSFIPWSLSNLQ